MSRELQPSLLSVSLVKIEPPTVIKNEPPESEIVEIGIDDILDSPEEEIISDLKDIDIVYHPLCEKSIKSEILESYHCESVETQVLVKAENSPFVKTENISQKNKTDDTNDENVIKGTGQTVVEIQETPHESVLKNQEEAFLARNLSNVENKEDKDLTTTPNEIPILFEMVSENNYDTNNVLMQVPNTNMNPIAEASNEHSNALSNVEIDEQSVLNFSKDLNSISVRSRKSKSPNKTDFAECYKTDDTTLWKKEKEKIKVIKAPAIPVEVHEYTSLTNDRHVCNHCQQIYKKMKNLKDHIRTKHRKVTTMYQCPYCPYKSKWSIRSHIIQNHKDTKDIQWFQCNLCEMKFKLKYRLTEHMKVHLKHKQIQDGLDLRRHHCDKCNYKTDKSTSLKSHKIIHLKPEEIEYFYCYHCSYKAKQKGNLKEHIFRHHFKNVKQGKRHHCDKCEYKSDASTAFKRHKLTHLKPEEIQYFYCYHCSYKFKLKQHLKRHIFIHFKKEQVQFDCYICNFMTSKRESIIKHIKKHSKVQKIRN